MTSPEMAETAGITTRWAQLHTAATPGERLAAITALEAALTALRERTVAQAVVVDGWTWPQVGAALGISRQGALKRYQRPMFDYMRARTRAVQHFPQGADDD